MSVSGDGTPGCAFAKPVDTIRGVIANMNEIASNLNARDGVGYFNRLYLAVTEAVDKGVEDAKARHTSAAAGAVDAAPRRRITGGEKAAEGSFELQDADFIARLDVLFANRYFKALKDTEDGIECSLSWRPLFEDREHARSPMRFAICGMNAHINHDLPVAIVETAKERKVELGLDTPQHQDFLRVNEVLAKVESELRGEFLKGALAKADHALHGELDKLAMWSIAEARDLAWRHAEFLWKVRKSADLTSAYRTLLSEFTALAGHGILA
jgi:Family of unknown function (DUF5995)